MKNRKIYDIILEREGKILSYMRSLGFDADWVNTYLTHEEIQQLTREVTKDSPVCFSPKGGVAGEQVCQINKTRIYKCERPQFTLMDEQSSAVSIDFSWIEESEKEPDDYFK